MDGDGDRGGGTRGTGTNEGPGLQQPPAAPRACLGFNFLCQLLFAANVVVWFLVFRSTEASERAAGCAESWLLLSKAGSGPAGAGSQHGSARPYHGQAVPSPCAAGVAGLGAGNRLLGDLNSGYPNLGDRRMGTGFSMDAGCSLLPCPLAHGAFSQPCSSGAVCLQFDRSSASPACLLHFLILDVGLSKSRAEPPRDQGEAGGPSVPSSFLIFFSPPSLLCAQSRAMMKLQLCLACSIHARHMLEIIVLGGALQSDLTRKRWRAALFLHSAFQSTGSPRLQGGSGQAGARAVHIWKPCDHTA